MEGGGPGRQRLVWQDATVTAVAERTPTVKSFFLRPPRWRSFLPGQHVDVRLTAPDGYQAERSYSIGSAPGSGDVELVIEKLEAGEVSPFFHDIVVPGDVIELRGPIGGHFTWTTAGGGPLLLVAGGSGVVPLMSMLRHRRAAGSDVPAVLVYSARHWADVIFREELMSDAAAGAGFSLVLTLTREARAEPGLRSGRIDMPLMAEALGRLGASGRPRHVFACGSSAFVDMATRLLLDGGIPFGMIRTERYGGDPAPAGKPAALPET